jgi:hypothetical protein
VATFITIALGGGLGTVPPAFVFFVQQGTEIIAMHGWRFGVPNGTGWYRQVRGGSGTAAFGHAEDLRQYGGHFVRTLLFVHRARGEYVV